MKAESKALATFFTTIGISMGIGGAIGANIYDYNPEAANKNDQEELEDLESRQIQLDLDRDVIVSDLGEGCIRLVNEYMDGGRLEDSSEDTMVNDLLREPGVPCGTSATEIRADVRGLTTAETAIVENEQHSEELDEVIDDRLKNGGNPAGHVALGMLGGALGGVFLGLYTGEVVYNLTNDEQEDD